MKTKLLAIAAAAASVGFGAAQPAYLDTSLSFEERAADLVSRMTLDEKCDQLGRTTKAVPRLGVARYDFWNEALHGIQNGTGEGTSFPMPLSLAVTWDEDFIRRVAEAIADECRGHSQPVAQGGRGRGLSYWCPTINLARHPLWGRTNEAWGEDPYVAGMLSSAFVEGMKGDDAKYLKTVPTIKHYALNDHENQRGSTSSDASEADIRDYYARVYRYVVERTDVPSLMSAYNAVNYTPSSGNPFLLTTLLRDTFGFTGFVVSDCGAIDNLERQQKWQPDRNTVQPKNYRMADGKALSDYVDPNGVVTKPGSVALALMAGCDMDCNGDVYPANARRAVAAGILDESQVDLNVYRSVLARFRLGEFDPVEKVAWRGDKYSFANTVETKEHRALADEAAVRGVVLLKNEGSFLPLDVRKLRKVVVVGDRADTCFLGNYHGKPKEKNRISCYSGIDDYLFVHNRATELKLVDKFGEDGEVMEEDRAAIAAADVVIIVAADEHDDSSEGKDREVLRLSRNQDTIAANVAKLNKNTVVFVQTSNVVELGLFKDAVKSILWSSQNGQGQGVGLARQIFGDVNPCGKLVFTWYAKESDLPGIRQYGLKKKFLPEEKDYPAGGYTYQYFKGAVDYPFGYGLSYTTFKYAKAKVSAKKADANGKVSLSVDVTNTGRREGSEIVQAYVVYPKGRGLPAKQIMGFAKVDLKPGETKTANIDIDVSDCAFWDGTKKVVPNGEWALEIAASAEDVKASFPLAVSGALAETVSVVTANPRDVVVHVGKTVASDVRFSLKDDRIFPASAAKVSYSSSDPSVATVCEKGVVSGVKPGVATITVKVDYKGSVKSASFPIAVTDGTPDTTDISKSAPAAKAPRAVEKPKAALYDRDALEEAIRIKVSGDDYDPETLAAYQAGIQKAREVFFDEDATAAQIDKACRELLAVKANLRDYRYLVADFRSANKLWHYNAGKSIWVNWARIRDAAGREVESDFTSHDPKKLQLRFTVTLEPSDYRTPFANAIGGGSWIKLRSRDVAQKDNDPDLQVFGGRLTDNNEHNYGWNVCDYIKDWGRTDVVIPLAVENPDGTTGLPFIDKGFRAQEPAHMSRGKIDWATIDRIFMNFNFQDKFKRSASVTAKIENCRVVDVTLEEEREKVAAMLDEKLSGSCDCPDRIALHDRAAKAAREAIAGENVVALRRAAAALLEARANAGYHASVNKDALRKAIEGRVRDFSRYTDGSTDEYKGLFRKAAAVYSDKAATQLEVNRAVRSLEGSAEILKVRRVDPHPISTLLEGEKSVESHGLSFGVDCDVDLSGQEDYDVTVRYEIKIEATHPNAPKSNAWLKYIVNGNARVWGEGSKKGEDAVRIAAMSCLRDSPMAAYERPGEWMTMTHKIPAAKLKGARLTRFETYMFNDSKGYMPDPPDGNNWNNDTGVKMTVRDIAVYTDRPE